MHYIAKAVPDTLLVKTYFNVLVGLYEAKEDPLEKESKIKNRSLYFAPYKQFVWWIYQKAWEQESS